MEVLMVVPPGDGGLMVVPPGDEGLMVVPPGDGGASWGWWSDVLSPGSLVR